MNLRLSADTHKAATVFLSHVRRTFQRYPTDYTGELVRLLDDIAVVTRSIASATSSTTTPLVTPGLATQLLYAALKNDGYACLILAKGTDQPLTFADDVPHGNYVVCVSPLDFDTSSPSPSPSPHTITGTTFSVYKRRSSASLPGRGIDLKQAADDQVAAGYCCYSSATTLHYTMRHGVYSFVLQPISIQYFLQPAVRILIPESSTVYAAREFLLRDPSHSPASAALQKSIERYRSRTFTTGGLVGDLHMLLQTGGILVHEDAHLLCEAAPIALVVEQAGGAAYTSLGKRVLDCGVEEDHNVAVTIVVGSKMIVQGLHLTALGSGNGNGHGDADRSEAVAMLDA